VLLEENKGKMEKIRDTTYDLNGFYSISGKVYWIKISTFFFNNFK